MMSAFNPNSNKLTPAEWQIKASETIEETGSQYLIIGGIVAGIFAASATGFPPTGFLIAGWTFYEAYRKTQSTNRNEQAIADYGCVAHVLKGDDFRAFRNQVGVEEVMRQIRWASDNGYALSGDALDFLEAETPLLCPSIEQPQLSGAIGANTRLTAIDVPATPVTTLTSGSDLPGASAPALDAGKPMDIALAMAYVPKSTIIAASPRVGKGFIVAKAISEIKKIFPDMEIWLIDPKNDPSELHYWLLIEKDKRVHYDLRDFNIDKYEATKTFEELLIRFNQSKAARKLLIVDEFVTLNQKCETEFMKRLKDFLVGICSSGELTPDQGMGRFAWIITQSPYVTDLGFKTKAATATFQRVFLLNKASLQSLQIAISASFVPAIESREVEYLLKETGRIFYYSRTNSWHPVPNYKINNPVENPTPIQPTDNVPQKLEQLYNSSSPAHETQELSDLAQKILAFFDAAKNQTPKTLRDMKKADRLSGYTDTQLIIALMELVQTKELIFDDKNSWSKSSW
jgi:hypothetical protein